MGAIASVFLWVVVFPHEGKLVTIDQLSFTRKGRMETNESIVHAKNYLIIENTLYRRGVDSIFH